MKITIILGRGREVTWWYLLKVEVLSLVVVVDFYYIVNLYLNIYIYNIHISLNEGYPICKQKHQANNVTYHTVICIKSQEIHAPLNGVNKTPTILILSCCHVKSILISYPNTLAPFVVAFVDY